MEPTKATTPTEVCRHAEDMIVGCVWTIDRDVKCKATHSKDLLFYNIDICVDDLDRLYSFTISYHDKLDSPLKVSLYNRFEYDILEKYKPGYSYDPLKTVYFNPENDYFEDEFTQEIYWMLESMGKDNKMAEKLLDMCFLQNAERERDELLSCIEKLTKVLPKDLQSSIPVRQLELLTNHFSQTQNDSK